jgi:predicted Zn-dependent protease
MRAMRDEVDRSAKVTVSGLAAPYFIEYVVDEEDNFTVTASLGGVVERRRQQFRSPQIAVRVGDYQFDNSNFAGGFSSGRGGGGLPVENSYAVLRRYFWLETDAAYKAAVETLSRKRAALRNVTQTDQINDFAHAAPVQYLGNFQKLTIDEDEWTGRIRTLSAVFAQFPSINYSLVDLDASAGGFYLVNTEGTEVRAPETVTAVRARATAQAPDGMNIADGVSFQSLGLSGMPSDAEMVKGITAMARNIMALQAAPKGEDYTGPVVFEGQAGAQILAEVLGRNLAPVRRPLGGAGGRGGAAGAASELEGRIGARVLPESFDVVDDPTQKEWRGRPLFGSYDVDREGVLPQPLRLVEKGVLKGFLMTREPVKGIEGSNGRARLPSGAGNSGAAISNLFVSSSDAVPAEDLKKKLIDLIQQRSKPYGILIRKMDFPSVGGVAPAGAQANGGRPVSAPIMLFKVYPDGHEEQVRGLRFRGLNAKSLKDILAAGDDAAPFEFMNSGRGFSAETCVVAPSILIDDLELYAPEEEQPKLPIAPAPEITR